MVSCVLFCTVLISVSLTVFSLLCMHLLYFKTLKGRICNILGLQHPKTRTIDLTGFSFEVPSVPNVHNFSIINYY